MHATFSLVSLIGAFAVLSSTALGSSQENVGPSHFRFSRAPLTTVTPTSPGPGDVFREGSQCSLQWTPGTGTAWKKMTISLMTGSNEAMQVLTNVATDVDGTSRSSYSWTCPEVSPNSAIYFYQFVDSHSANPTWTTRFTIAGPNGESTTPTESEQSNGATVLWRTGSLSSGSGSSSSSSGSSGSDSSTGSSTTGSSGSSGTSSASNGSGSSDSSSASPSSSASSSDSASSDSSSTSSSSSSAPAATTSSTSSSSTSSTSSTSGSGVAHTAQAVLVSMVTLAVAVGLAM